LEFLSTTADDADDMPGAELSAEEKGDFMDSVPKRVEVSESCFCKPTLETGT